MSRTGLLAFTAILFLALTSWSARTERPGVDEGLFADPAFQLLHQGHLGSALPTDRGNSGVNARTYYVHPLFLLVEAAWFRVAGFGVGPQRTLSVLFGLIGLSAWYSFLRRFTGDQNMALMAVVLVALDYYYLLVASSGRPDMMTAALGFCSYAAYLRFRDSSLVFAVFASQTCTALSGLTHPMGVLHFAALCFLTLALDRGRLRWRHILAGAFPYVVGAAAWGIYIAQSPGDFVAQYWGNVQDGGRLRTLAEPWRAFWLEAGRYIRSAGFGPHTSGHGGPIRLKALIILGYLMGLVGVWTVRRQWQRSIVRILAGMLGLQLLLLTFIDGQKAYYYLVHVLPFYLTFLALWVVAVLRRSAVSGLALLAGLAVLPLLGCGATGFRAFQNNYQRVFRPAVAFAKARLLPGNTVGATPAYGFDFGFSRDTLLTDSTLGYHTGRTPDLLIVDQEKQGDWDSIKARDPAEWAYVEETLSHFRRIYDHGSITVLAAQEGPAN